MNRNSSWKSVRLGEIAGVISGFAFRSQDFQSSGICVIKIANIRLGYVDISEAQKVDPSFLSLDEKYHVKRGDVLISLTGSHLTQPNSVVGRVALFRGPLQQCLLNQRAGKVIVRDPLVCDSRFLFYVLSQPDQMRTIATMAHGAASQANVSPTQVESIRLTFPPLQVQHRIAAILSAYDDLIENNTRRIKILEEMAQALYREWFVRFRFPGHEKMKMVASAVGSIPVGWDVGRLDDALILQRGFDLPIQNRRTGPVPIFAATGVVGTHDEARVKGPGIVTGRSGSLGTVIYVDTDFWPLNTTLWVKEFRRATPALAFFLLTDLKLGGFNSGAAVPTLNRNDIHGLPVILAPASILSRFDECVLPLFALKKTLEARNINLRRTRDLLLPKLISGEIDISSCEKESVSVRTK